MHISFPYTVYILYIYIYIYIHGRDFPHPSILALGPTQPPVQWVRGLIPGSKRPGCGVNDPPPSRLKVKLSRNSPGLGVPGG